ncbi:MAG: hypothetical protein KJ063_12495 [Anaerolineae bacterium]|nr:hypothetical protein [Anaerolineae bacterium]
MFIIRNYTAPHPGPLPQERGYAPPYHRGRGAGGEGGAITCTVTIIHLFSYVSYNFLSP